MIRTEILWDKQVEGVLPENYQVYHFDSGSELTPFTEVLMPDLIRVWGSALSRSDDDPLVVEDSAKYPFVNTNSLFLVEDQDGLAAIYLYHPIEYQGMRGVYVNICLVDQEHQGQGLMKRLIQASIERTEAKFLCLHTQNPHMVRTVRSFCPEGYLFPIDSSVSGQGLELAQLFCHNAQQFDGPVMIERGMYLGGNPLYGDRRERRTTDVDIEAFFENNVDFQKGDSVLVIGFLPDRF